MEDTVDIDEAQEDDPAALRDALLDQAAHLIDEIDALRTVAGGLPDEIKCGRPAPDALTMKEIYGALATLDEDVRGPWVRRLVEEDTPSLSSVDIEAEVREGNWNETELGSIFDRVQEARRQLVDRLDALPLEAWHRTATLNEETLSLFELVYQMIQQDLQRLRDLGYRLHGAHLSERDEPLPT